MSPALLLPAALGALAALLIPVVIHIARRTERRRIDFAALRWLEPRPKPRRRLRLDELWLLAIRLALLALVALGLAQPVLWGAQDDRRIIAVAPALDANALKASGDARRVWLAPGFPPLDAATPAAPADLVSLIRQLDAESPREAPLELVVPAVLDGVDAERPRLSRPVTWRVMPQTRPTPTPEPTLPPALMVRHAAGAEDQVRYFRAAATAWTRPGLAPAFNAAPVETPLDADARYLIWLSPGPLPPAVVAWMERGGVALAGRDVRPPVGTGTRVAWRDPVGAPLAMEASLGRGRVIHLTRALAPASMPELLEPDFPDALARLLAPGPAPARVAAAEHAPLTGARAYEQPPLDLRPWLALLVALIFAVERWLATSRRRAAAP